MGAVLTRKGRFALRPCGFRAPTKAGLHAAPGFTLRLNTRRRHTNEPNALAMCLIQSLFYDGGPRRRSHKVNTCRVFVSCGHTVVSILTDVLTNRVAAPYFHAMRSGITFPSWDVTVFRCSCLDLNIRASQCRLNG